MIRNNSVDTFKLLASFAVILLHVKYGSLPIVAVNNIRLLGRFGVPFFFLVSGFFFYQNYIKAGDKSFTKTLQRVVGTFIIGCLVYALLKLDKVPFSYLLLFQGTYHHLWFLSSLVFGLIICWYHYSYLQSKIIMIFLSALILVTSLFSDSYSFLVPFKIDPVFSRYLLSIPFLYFGMLIAEKKFIISNWLSIALIAGGIFLQVAESLYLFKAHGYNPYDLQIMAGTLPFSAGMFFLSLKGFSNEKMGALGRKYSLAIYVYHPFVNFFLFSTITKLFVNFADVILWFSPLISFGVTLLILMTLERFLPTIFQVLNGDLKKFSDLGLKRRLVVESGLAANEAATISAAKIVNQNNSYDS